MNLFKVCTAVLVIIWFTGLGYRDLVEPDEGRYAEIPREMVQSGDWTTPRLNDLKYFEKPALQYWLTAVSYKLFGFSNASARLWIALASFFCATFVGFLAARLYGSDVGRYTFLLSASSLLFVGSGHYLTLDMTLTFFMTLGIGCPILAMSQNNDPGSRRNWMLAGWAALACAVLTKGLVGIVLPGMALALYILWSRNWSLIKELHIVKGLALFLLICAPWFLNVSSINQEFAQFFFIHEHFDRYTTDVHHRVEPAYFFIGVFVVGIAPWLVNSCKALFRPEFSWRHCAGETFNAERFMWVFIVATFVFFSLAHSKLPAYILPVFPFVAILAAKRIAKLKVVGGDSWTMMVAALIVLVLALLGAHFSSHKIPPELIEMFQPWLFASAVALAMGSAALFKWKLTPQRAVPVASVCATLSTLLLMWGFQAIAVSRSSADEARAIQSHVSDSSPIYAVGTYPQALPFYLKRTITLVGYTGELKMGINSEPEKQIPTLDEFLQHWEQEQQAVAVVPTKEFEDFTARTSSYRVIYEGPRRTVVTKH